MSYSIPSHRLQEIVAGEKCPQDNVPIQFHDRGAKGKQLDIRLDLTDGPFLDLRFAVRCGDIEQVGSYHSSLLAAAERVRGIDYGEVERRKKYQPYIPTGWHENVIDPNLPTTDLNRNRHMPLENFDPTDLQDFTRLSAERWHIVLAFGEDLL